ncbi:MAG: pyruvate carboxylase [Vicinamibacterales bacterium]|nr:pyruvate carboxylase [Vicinamibacterales bacterium]
MKKLLVANRSEIAIRIFRAATELGLQTVAVYSFEDRFSLHRFKADEAFLIGPAEGGEPVRSYLNIAAVIDVAKRQRADAIHPGYGFLSENADFARACAAAGMTFVGPTPAQLEAFGDKVASKVLARKANVPTVPGTEAAVATLADVRAAAKDIGFPLIIKASFGGGGRGMRVVHNAGDLAGKLEEAQREAGAAFGRTEVFVERFVTHAKHIEVQVLGDKHGNLVHLWERDCSVQRRHQKVVEMAPSINLPLGLRKRICDAAVRLCRTVKYQSAGTVEFLVDTRRKEFYFIEVNPRIQVEHTVTEVVTGIDLVRSQLLVAQGRKLHQAPLSIPRQDGITTSGVALQCRITTEDPENHFIPDYGRISTYRSPGGFAVRLDGGNGFGGAVITPYFDSLLVKMTTWGQNLEEAVRRTDRSLREFRIRGVKTNIAFLGNLILHPVFMSGAATTDFVDSTPELFRFRAPRDRATKVLSYLGDVIVNGRPEIKGRSSGAGKFTPPLLPDRGEGRGEREEGETAPAGLRQKLQALGPAKFSQWVRSEKRLLITDTTMRDAHQSLLATRVRTYDLLAAAEVVAHQLPNLFSLEMWGGATFDTSMRFLQEDPWDRLVQLRARIPNILFQMLLRASNTVGYTNYPDNVVREFIRKSGALGIDVFRVFDSLNSTPNMKVAMDAVRKETKGICEAAVCYTGDILDPSRTKYSLKYYVKMAKELERMGAHMLAVKDMAGLCKPYAAHALVKALRDEIDLPIHFHTHDTSGIQGASILRASDAGVDIVDAAIASMSGMTSQPCLNSIVAALRNTSRDTGLDQDSLDALSDYWAAVRELYHPFEEGLKAPASDVYRHEMPGGQFTNLRQQAKGLGLEGRWQEISRAYAAANQLLGDIVKVTPSSKVVGDLALFMVTNNLRAEDLLNARTPLNYPRSVVEMLQGMLGEPDGGWPKPFQRTVLESAKATPIKGRPGAKLPRIDFKSVGRELAARLKKPVTDEDVLSYVLYPQVFLDFAEHRRQFGDTSVIPTANFFYGLQSGDEIAVEIEKGKTLIIRFLTLGEVREDGTRTVFFEMNGQPREVRISDRAVDATLQRHPKADPDDPDHIAAPMPGKISSVAVKKGDTVRAGDRILSIEAMKMETAVYSPRDCAVAEVAVKAGSTVEARDLLAIIQG